MSALDTAIFWTEYVIRHKGAPHLRPAILDLAWYQYLLLDVIAFVCLCTVVFTFIAYTILRKLVRILNSRSRRKTKQSWEELDNVCTLWWSTEVCVCLLHSVSTWNKFGSDYDLASPTKVICISNNITCA